MPKRILTAAAALALASCAPMTIGRINSDPSRYRNRSVSVTGRVVTSVGILDTGAYQIEDGTGRIYVISRSGVPSSGSQVKVTGTVIPGAQVLGRPLGTAIREEKHKVR